MTDIAIRTENLSKRYRLGLIGRTALYEDLSRWWARLRGRSDPTMRLDQLQKLEAHQEASSGGAEDPDHIWALRDINFDVQQGEVLGIIGRNGADKSTLLKVLSRVTAPTLGCVKFRGRIASLLEVGTGFHPELTGRENIFLNGTILGMSNAEIRGKFDEIVAFAEVEKFIETPVKRYSSGMYVRLAFAVAAHLEPEILVVDEVLAVGDASFRKRCLGKMKDVAGEGRTVLFVSHNMASIRNLCSRAIWLSAGRMEQDGPSSDVVTAYVQRSFSPEDVIRIPASAHRTISPLQIHTLGFLTPSGGSSNLILRDQDVVIRLGFRSEERLRNVVPGCEVFSGGQVLFSVASPPCDPPAGQELQYATCRIPGGKLLPGAFDLHVGASVYGTRQGLDWVTDAATFSISAVADQQITGDTAPKRGLVDIPQSWEFSPEIAAQTD